MSSTIPLPEINAAFNPGTPIRSKPYRPVLSTNSILPKESCLSSASKVKVYIESTPNVRNPIMVCGLPDSGNVATLVIEELVKQLGAEKFAEIYLEQRRKSVVSTREHIDEGKRGYIG